MRASTTVGTGMGLERTLLHSILGPQVEGFGGANLLALPFRTHWAFLARGS